MSQSLLIIVVISLLLGAAGLLSAQETALSEVDQFPVLCKLLMFDEGRIPTAGDTVKFAVLADRTYRPSMTSRDELFHAATVCPFKTIDERPIALVSIDFDETGLWQSAVLAERADILYVTPLGSNNIQSVIAFTRIHGVISITGVEDYVRQGVALGVGMEESRPKLLLNDAGVEAEGIKLKGHVPRLARRYRQ